MGEQTGSCLRCGSRGKFAVRDNLAAKLYGTYSLAGCQPKVAAEVVLTMICDPELDGCGWQVPCRLDGDGRYVIVDEADIKASLTAEEWASLCHPPADELRRE
jgi:hypothetical protein